MPTIPQALAIALEHHQAGRLPQAEQIYRQIIDADPQHAEALHLLGVLAHQVGRNAVAVEYIGRAVALRPDAATYHNNLGTAYRCLDRLAEAAACYRRAIQLAPDFTEAHYNLGNTVHAQGDCQQAIACYRRTLQLRPGYAEAHNNLGAALQGQGNTDEAAACYRRAVELRPDYAEAIYNLGSVSYGLGRRDEAEQCFRRALELRPDYAEARNSLGNVLQDQGRLDEAIACYRRALEHKPDLLEARNNLGNVLKQQDQLDESVLCYRQALALRPDSAEVYTNLGVVLRDQDKFDEAVACYRRALELKPDYFQAHNNLGVALRDQGKLDEAMASLRRALELDPDSSEAYNNVGITLRDQKKSAEARDAFRKALQLHPDYAEAHYNLGILLQDEGKLTEAFAGYRRALELKPTYADAYNNLGNAYKEQGELDEAMQCYQRAFQIRPRLVIAHSNALCCEQYRPGVTLARLADVHNQWEQRHAAPLRNFWQPYTPARDADAPLRLGFVSADFARHPVGFFLVRALESLRAERCEIVCYSNRWEKDEITARIGAAADVWREVLGWSDDVLARQIRADRVQILFDLSGHTAGNRLLCFARKPAPFQATWIGYEGTTGLAAMDYIIADGYEIPPHLESHYREQVLRMPEGYLCYDPPADAPPVAPLPALAAGHVTFGSFNNLGKITPPVVRVWAEILRQIPRARLVLKYRGLADENTRRRYLELFAAQGVDADRLELLGWSPHPEFLAEHHRIDVALDPFPFSGSITTCTALWMGVPVVTCPGETFASRHTFGHLSNIGLTETIARDFDDYVRRAVELAGDLPRLAALRAGLRPRMAASPLCDGPRFARNFVELLRRTWRQKMENSPRKTGNG